MKQMVEVCHRTMRCNAGFLHVVYFKCVSLCFCAYPCVSLCVSVYLCVSLCNSVYLNRMMMMSVMMMMMMMMTMMMMMMTMMTMMSGGGQVGGDHNGLCARFAPAIHGHRS